MSNDTFVTLCPISRLSTNRGVAALVDTVAVALFLLEDGSLHAVDNFDPCCGASVLSRGIIGEADGEWTVASPMHKQRFSLITGRCLDAAEMVTVHEARTMNGQVQVRLARRPPSTTP